MRAAPIAVLLLMIWIASAWTCAAQAVPGSIQSMPQRAPTSASSFDHVVDRIIEQEHALVKLMAYLKPVVETYLQDTKFDAQLGSVPTSDEYFLGRLSVKGFRIEETSYLDTARPERRISAGLTSFSRPRYAGVKFARMILPDPTSLDRHHYSFSFVRWEMLGDVRCLLVDVVPVPHSGDERSFASMERLLLVPETLWERISIAGV